MKLENIKTGAELYYWPSNSANGDYCRGYSATYSIPVKVVKVAVKRVLVEGKTGKQVWAMPERITKEG